MKIKVWLFVLVLCGTLVIGVAGGFVVSQGFSLARMMLENIRIVRAADAPNVQAQLPDMPFNGWGDMKPGRGWQGGMPNDGTQGGQSDQAGILPPGFNAGVSIPGTYGEMTNRTEDQVLADAEKAGTDTWGLAKKEGKLDELKTKVLGAVTASLDKMITDGKITKEQKDAYVEKVNAILQIVGQTDTAQPLPFGGEEPAGTDKPGV